MSTLNTARDTLVNYTDARKELGNVPVSTFLSWIRAGLLTPVKIGPRRSFIRRSDIDRLMQAS